MLEFSPVHVVYNKPYVPLLDMQTQQVDVSADKIEDAVEVNFRIDLSHMMMMNLFLNFILLILLALLLLKK